VGLGATTPSRLREQARECGRIPEACPYHISHLSRPVLFQPFRTGGEDASVEMKMRKLVARALLIPGMEHFRRFRMEDGLEQVSS